MNEYPRLIFDRRMIALALLALACLMFIIRGWDRPVDAGATQSSALIEPAPRPISIHAGWCGELDDVAWPLNALTSPEGPGGGSADADRTEYSFTANVPLTISALLDGDFAINVLESETHSDRSLACGNVGGVPDAVGTLVLGLRVQGETNVTGIAVLSPSPSDSSRTLISVFITGSDLGSANGADYAKDPTVVPGDDETSVVGEPTSIVVPTEILPPTAVLPDPTEDDPDPTEVDDDDDDDDNEGPGNGDDDDDDDGDNSGHG